MTTYNIATAVNIDSLAAKAGSDTYNILNDGYLTVDQDSRYGLNNTTVAAMGNIAMAAGGKCTIEFNAEKVRLIPYDTGTGNVPVSNTAITQGSATGLLIGVYASLVVAPTASGSAMPASGYIKIKQWNDVAYTVGALGGIGATATGPDVVGWIEIVGVNAMTVTVNRLNTFKVRGAWYDLGTASGSSATTYQIPNNGSAVVWLPGVWVETAVADVYEFYPLAANISALAASIATDAVRGKVCWISTAGVLRFQNDGANNTGGYLPPVGRKIRIPNIFFFCCIAAAVVNILPSATLATRYDFTTTGGAVIDIDTCCMDWYLSLAQPYSVTLTNAAFLTAISVAEIGAYATWSQVGIGQETPVNTQVALTMSLCFAGGSFTDCTWVRAAQGATGHYVTSFTDVSGFTFTRNTFRSLVFRGHAVTGAGTWARVVDCVFHDCIVNTRLLLTTCANLDFFDTVYFDHIATTTVATYPHYIFDLATNCDSILIDGITFGGLTLNQPYSGILDLATAGCSNIKLRNLGTYASPLDLGGAQRDGVAWSRVTTTATVTSVAHGLKTGDIIYVLVSDSVAAITVGSKTLLSAPTADTFTFTCLNAGNASGVLTYYPTMTAYLFLCATGAAAKNIEIKRCYTPHTRTGLYSSDNSSKGFLLENIRGDYINAPLATAGPLLNLEYKGCHATPALTAQISTYGTHWFDSFIMETSAATSPTWSHVTTTATVTSTDHNLRTGMQIVVTVCSNEACIVLGTKSVTVLTKDTFTFTCIDSGTTGTLTFVPVTGRIGVLMDEETAQTAAYITKTGTVGFTSAGTLFFPAAADAVTWEMPDYCIGHTIFPVADMIVTAGAKNNLNFQYWLDLNDGYGYTRAATWTRSTTTATVTVTNHGLPTGSTVTVAASSDTAAITDGAKTGTVVDANTFTFTCLDAGAASGTLTALYSRNLNYPRAGGGGSGASTNVTVTDTTGIAIGDYVFGTNIGWLAKVTSITNGTTFVVDIANRGTVEGVLTFNHLPSETSVNAELGFKLKVKAAAILGTSAATWTRSGTTATMTLANHGLKTNDIIYVTISSDISSITVGAKTVTYATENTVTFTCLAGTGSPGTLTFTYPAMVNWYVGTNSTEASRAYQYPLDVVPVTVTCLDVNNAPVAGVVVTVHKSSDLTQLLQATTNASGVASGEIIFYAADPNVLIWTRKSSPGDTRYINGSSIQTATVDGLAVTMSLQVDPNV